MIIKTNVKIKTSRKNPFEQLKKAGLYKDEGLIGSRLEVVGYKQGYYNNSYLYKH